MKPKRHKHPLAPKCHPCNQADHEARFAECRGNYHPTKGWRLNAKNPIPGYAKIYNLFLRAGIVLRITP